jgi:transmembrane sensor
MRKYSEYQVEDFIQDSYFRRWALEQLSPEDQFWPTWQAEHPEKYETVEQAKVLVIAFQFEYIPTDPDEVKSAVQQILSDIEKKPAIPIYRKEWTRIAAATVILLIAGLSFSNRFFPWENELLREVNDPIVKNIKESLPDNSGTRTVLLSDGTRIELAAQSKLRIGKEFGQLKREVYLTGEATFDVAKDVHKPFFVYTGKVVTKVLGTRFKIKAFNQDTNISIAVRSGSVTVFKNEPKKPDKYPLADKIVLTPNQRAVFIKENQQLIKTLVEDPVILCKQAEKLNFTFNEAPVSEVLATLEKAYLVKISCDKDLIKGFNLKATLANESLFEKLDLICEAINARYEIIDGQVVLYGKVKQ